MSALNLIGIIVGAAAGGIAAYHYGFPGLAAVVAGQVSILLAVYG